MADYYLVREGHGPAWDEARSRREQDGWDEHARFMDALVEDGVVVLGGPVGEDLDGDALLLLDLESEADVRAANCLATGGLIPELTIVFDFPVADGIERVSQRGSHDRIESSAIDFHERVERAFAESATREWQDNHPECGPITQVDGRGSRDDVAARVVAALLDAMPQRFSALREEMTS